jgi:hypothetical protein
VNLRDIYEQYHEQVQFLTIYIREAHPIDGWWLGGGVIGALVRMGIPNVATDLSDPKTIAERRAVAGQCAESLQYGIRTYVDEMDDAVNKAYAAHPTRLYFIDLHGRVAYAGGLGPYGFSPTALKAAIETYLEFEHLEPHPAPITGD